MKSTPYNLVMSALYKGIKGDRPPAGNPTSIACHGLMVACGVSFPEAHLNPQAMAELALPGHEILGFDTVIPEYSVDQEAAALGCEVDWGDRNTMPATIASAKAQFKAGADVVVLADHVTGNLVGAYHYEEYLLPIQKELTTAIEGPLILHVCGNCTDRLEMFANAGFDGYHFEWQVDSKVAVEKVGDRISLVGNVPNELLRSGTVEEVKDYTEHLLREVAPGGGYCVGSGNSVPVWAKFENYMSMRDTTLKHGPYPIIL